MHKNLLTKEVDSLCKKTFSRTDSLDKDNFIYIHNIFRVGQQIPGQFFLFWRGVLETLDSTDNILMMYSDTPQIKSHPQFGVFPHKKNPLFVRVNNLDLKNTLKPIFTQKVCLLFTNSQTKSYISFLYYCSVNKPL